MAGPLTEAEELELLELELEEAQMKARQKAAQPASQTAKLATGKQAALDARNARISTSQSVARAARNQANVERRARVMPVEQQAGRAGAAAMGQGLMDEANPNAAYSEFMLPPDAQRGLMAEREVYRDKDVTSSVDAASLGLANSAALGVPGIVNKDFRGELAAASVDQPGAYMGGTLAGVVPSSIGLWNTVRAPINALARPFTPRGADAASRFGRYAAPRAGEVAGAASQNALIQGAVMEPVRAEAAGEDYTLAGALDAAGRGATDPLNLLPLGLSGINRTWNAATSGIATPSRIAADMANRFGVGPRQTTASQGIAQTTQQLGGQLQGADVRGLTNIENALRFALRDNPNIPNVNARIADGFQRIRQSLPLEDDPTLNLARLIEREFANDAPQTRDIIRRFLSKVGQETPGGEAIVGGAANDIRGRQADVLEREAYSVFGSQSKDEAKQVLEGNKKTLGKQGYAAALDNLVPDAPGQEAALQRIATRDDAQGILFEAADAEGMSVEQYIQRNPLKSLHEIRASLAADARDLRAANNPDFDLERTVKSMDAVLEANVPNYKEIRKMYRSEATAFDRLGTTRDQRAGTEGELSYIPGFGDKLFGAPPNPSAATRAEGRATAKSIFDSMDEQSKKAAALSVRDVILDDLSKARAAGVNQRYEIAAKFQRLNSEGALKALVDVFGEGGQRIVNRIRQFVDANEFASAIDPMAGSNTMNKAQNLATGAQPFAGGMGQRAQGTSNALSESAIADSVLMLSGAPPIISAMRAPGIIGKMLQPGQRTQRNIASTLLRRGEIGSQVPPLPGGPPPIVPIDPASVPGNRPANALSGQTMSNQQTVGPASGVASPPAGPTRTNSLPIGSNTQNALSGMAIGSLGGSANDLNGDGKRDWKDAAIGAAGGAALGGAPGLVRGARNAFASGTKTAGAGGGRGPRKPKADSPEAISNAVRDLAKTKKPEPTRFERMVEENQIPVNSPEMVVPDAAQAAGNRAQRMLERGKDPFEIYDETSIVYVPYNGKNIPILSPQQGPEEVIRTFYMWLRKPKETWPQFVTDIVKQAPRKRTMRLGDENAAAVPPGAVPPPPQPLPPDGVPYGAIAGGAALGAATGVAGGTAGYMAYDALTRDKPRNALSGQ